MIRGHKHFPTRREKIWPTLQRLILISLGRRLVSGIHWVVWASAFGDLAMRQRSVTCVTRRLSMAESPWLHSLVTAHSQPNLSLGPMANCLLKALSPASLQGSSGMPFHLSQSSRYWYWSACSSRTVRAPANPRATCTTPRVGYQAIFRQSRVDVLSSYSTCLTHSIGSRRTKTKSVAVR